MQGYRHTLVGLVVAVCLASAPAQFAAPGSGIPDRLTNTEFWRLSAEFSEPTGYFNSDNLVSNEDTYQSVIPELTRIVGPGGVYAGRRPGPELHVHRGVEPCGRVHSRRAARQSAIASDVQGPLRAVGRPRRVSVATVFAARPGGADGRGDGARSDDGLYAAAPDQERYEANLLAVLDHLARHRGAALEPDDRAGVEFVLHSFFVAGPDLAFVSSGGFRRSSRYPPFAALQMATDLAGIERAYLSTEARFRRVKVLQERNLIVPVVGNFAGPRALKAIGAWVREHGGVVTTIYTSNVEQYLFQDAAWDQFRRNVASMPLDGTSTFIRSCFNSCSAPGGARAVTLLDSVSQLLEAAATGRIGGYWDVLTHSRSPITAAGPAAAAP